jgi:hypothetical protein
LKVSGFDDPSDITTGAEVDPEAKHVPADVARDIESLRDRVDEDHDFGASYDFTPSSIDSPSDTPYRPPDDIRPGDLNDVSEEVASEVATSSLDYTFGPRRSIEEDLGISSGYRFGPARSLEEDLGAGVSKTWAETMQNVSRIEDTSASYMAPSYDFGQSAYDFDTSDLYDFTPPEYDDAGTTEKTVLTDGNDSSTVSKNASRFPPDQSSGISSGESSSSSVPTGADMSTMAGDVSAMGSRVMGIATGLTGTAKKKTNEGADLGLVFQLFLIICILTGLTYLVLSI